MTHGEFCRRGFPDAPEINRLEERKAELNEKARQLMTEAEEILKRLRVPEKKIKPTSEAMEIWSKKVYLI